jgi:hypothetical protein
VKKAKEALAASESEYKRLCARVQEEEVRRNAIEDELLDGRVQLQALQKEVGDIEAECRRDEDVLRDLELKDAAAAGGSVQVPFRVLCASRFPNATNTFPPRRPRPSSFCPAAASAH